MLLICCANSFYQNQILDFQSTQSIELPRVYLNKLVVDDKQPGLFSNQDNYSLYQDRDSFLEDPGIYATYYNLLSNIDHIHQFNSNNLLDRYHYSGNDHDYFNHLTSSSITGVALGAMAIPMVPGFSLLSGLSPVVSNIYAKKVAIIVSAILIGISSYKLLDHYYHYQKSGDFLAVDYLARSSDFGKSSSRKPLSSSNNRYLSRSKTSQSNRAGSSGGGNNPKNEQAMIPAISQQQESKNLEHSTTYPSTRVIKDHHDISSSVRKKQFVPYSSNDDIDYIFNFESELSKQYGYRFRSFKYHGEDPFSEQAENVLGDLSKYFVDHMTKDDISARIKILAASNQVKSEDLLDDFTYVNKNFFRLWFLKKYGKIDLAIALKFLTSYSISDNQFAKVFEITQEDFLHRKKLIKENLISFFSNSFLIDNFHPTEASRQNLADYLVLKFASSSVEEIPGYIKNKFYFKFHHQEFHHSVLFFIDIFDLNDNEVILLLGKISDMSSRDRDKDLQRLINVLNVEALEDKKHNFKSTYIIEALEQLLISDRITGTTYESFWRFLDIIEDISSFESMIMPRVEISYSNQQDQSISYNYDLNLTNRLDWIIQGFRLDNPDILESYDDRFLKIILFTELAPSYLHSAFMKRVTKISESRFFELKEQLTKFYRDTGPFYRHLGFPNRRVLAGMSDIQILTLFGELIIYNNVTPEQDAHKLRRMLLDFYNQYLSNSLEKHLYLTYVLRLKQPTWFTLQATINRFKENFPSIEINGGVFNIHNHLIGSDEQSEIVMLIYEITKEFVEFIGKNILPQSEN